jgi:hypothetical protein
MKYIGLCKWLRNHSNQEETIPFVHKTKNKTIKPGYVVEARNTIMATQILLDRVINKDFNFNWADARLELPDIVICIDANGKDSIQYRLVPEFAIRR